MDSARAKMTTHTKNFKRNLSTSASPPFTESGQPLFSQQRIFPAPLTGPFDFSKFCRTLQYHDTKAFPRGRLSLFFAIFYLAHCPSRCYNTKTYPLSHPTGSDRIMNLWHTKGFKWKIILSVLVFLLGLVCSTVFSVRMHQNALEARRKTRPAQRHHLRQLPHRGFLPGHRRDGLPGADPHQRGRPVQAL